MQRLIVTILFGQLIFLCSLAFAQQSKPTNSGKLPWIVTKLKLNDFTGKSDTIIADFDTKDEAVSYAQQMIENEKTFAWTYNASERSPEDDRSKKAIQEAMSPKQTAPPDLTVRKGQTPIPSNSRPVDVSRDLVSLVGKTGQGNFGDVSLSIEFISVNDVVFTDPISKKRITEGRWKRTGNLITIETPNYIYRGMVDAKGIVGWRIKNSKNLSDEIKESWKIDFRDKKPAEAMPAEKASPNAKLEDSLVGTWIGEVKSQDGGTRVTMTFRPDGTATYGVEAYYDGDFHPTGPPASGTWYVKNGLVYYKGSYAPVDFRFADGKLLRDAAGINDIKAFRKK